MASVILKALLDGEHIVLDEPFDLPPNAPLAVTVLLPEVGEQEQEREKWTSQRAQALARAYRDAEPEYTIADVKQ